MASNIPSFKVVLVGDPGTGKTAFIKRHMTGEFQKIYTKTVCVKMHCLKFNTTRGPIMFHVWDMAVPKTFFTLRNGFYIHSLCAIIFFDVTTKATYSHVPKWQRDIARVCDKIPIVMCGNKMDIWDRKRSFKMDPQYRARFQYYPISVKSNLNIEKPFLWLARALVGDFELEFVESPAMMPSEKKICKSYLWKFEKDVANAGEFPDEDDTDL